MRACSDVCKKSDDLCPEENKSCRFWINYEDDLNCSLISIDKADGRPMTLRDIGLRLNVSHVRIDQIEREVTKKLVKKLRNNDLFR